MSAQKKSESKDEVKFTDDSSSKTATTSKDADKPTWSKATHGEPEHPDQYNVVD